jgi:hypothetical protein
MRRVDITSASKLAELLDLAGEENVLLKTPDGREFVLAEVDDFDAEIEAVCQNQELMKLLEERSREEKTYSLAEVEKKLGLA